MLADYHAQRPHSILFKCIGPVKWLLNGKSLRWPIACCIIMCVSKNEVSRNNLVYKESSMPNVSSCSHPVILTSVHVSSCFKHRLVKMAVRIEGFVLTSVIFWLFHYKDMCLALLKHTVPSVHLHLCNYYCYFHTSIHPNNLHGLLSVSLNDVSYKHQNTVKFTECIWQLYTTCPLVLHETEELRRLILCLIKYLISISKVCWKPAG